MEDVKPIIFDDGLREVFEHPLSEWPNLQNAIQTNPEKMDYLDVVLYRTITYCSVLKYLFNHNPYILQLILTNVKHDYLKNTPDLTSHEIYEIASHLSLNNSKTLLQQKFGIGVYTRLIDTIQNKDEKSFVDVLSECDLTGIMHILKILHVPIKLYRTLDDWNMNCDNESDSIEGLLERYRYFLRKSLVDIYGNSPQKASFHASSTVVFIRSIIEDESGFNKCLSLLYGITCSLKKLGCFDETEIKVLEYILKSPPLQECYNQSLAYWDDGKVEERFEELTQDLFKEESIEECRKRKRKRISAPPLSRSYRIDGEIIEESQPHIDEPATVEPQPERLSAADYNQTPRPKFTPEQRETIKNFYISPNYFKDTSQGEDTLRKADDHCTITNEKFYKIDAKVRAKKFKAFIKLLAREGCIDPTNEAMQLCAYAFTGIEFKHPFQPGFAKWRKEKVDILLFICTKFYKRNKESSTNFVKALEVFQVTAEGNRNKRAESVIGTRFDVKFTEVFSDGNTPIRSIFD